MKIKNYKEVNQIITELLGIDLKSLDSTITSVRDPHGYSQWTILSTKEKHPRYIRIAPIKSVRLMSDMTPYEVYISTGGEE